MKRIAIVGAPGSGKSALANKISERIPPGPIVIGDTSWPSGAIVDGYAQRLSDDTDIALGHFAGYTNNLQVAFERLRWERGAEAQARQTDRPLAWMITCGTLIETVIYTGFHSKSILTAPDDVAQVEILRAESVAYTLAQLTWDTWEYDYVFVNPLAEAERDQSWNSILDADLIKGLEAFFIDHVVLDPETSLDQRANHAYAVISATPE